MKIGEHDYEVGKIPAMTQFHITRRLGPTLVQVLPVLGGQLNRLFADASEVTQDEKVATIRSVFEILPGAAIMFAQMPDADAEYVINSCLDVCRRVTPTGSFAMRTNGTLQYADISMTEMLQLAWEAIMSNMGGFFPTGLLQGLDSIQPK